MRKFRVLFSVCGLVLISACGLLVEEGRQVVAQVGEEPIRLDDLWRRIRQLPFQERVKTNDADVDVRLQARKSILEGLVVEELLRQEARNRNIEVTEEEALAVLEREESLGNSAGQAIEGMEGGGDAHAHDHGHSGEGHSHREVELRRDKLAMEKLLAEELSEDVLLRYYNTHIDEFAFSPPRQSYEMFVVSASHGEAVDLVREKALRQGGSLAEAFASLQRKPAVIFLGVTPPTPLSNVVPAMRDKVQDLEVGQVSEPFHLHPGGSDQYAVARLVNRIEKAPFESVKGQIYAKLYNAFITDLRQKFGVEYYEDKLDYRLGR